MDSEQKDTKLVFVDGRDALATVIVKRGKDGGGVLIDAYANGIGKREAARILRHVADLWDKDAAANGN